MNSSIFCLVLICLDYSQFFCVKSEKRDNWQNFSLNYPGFVIKSFVAIKTTKTNDIITEFIYIYCNPMRSFFLL